MCSIIIGGLTTSQLLLLAIPYQVAIAFSHHSVLHSSRNIQNFDLKTIKPLLSSIGDDEDPFQPKSFLKPPSPPEDLLTLSGDVLTIFMYTYIDHEATWLFDILSVSSSHHALIASSDEMNSRVPVWFDSQSVEPFGSIPLSSAIPMDHHFLYTPAIMHPGLASVLFAMVWIFTSLFTEALHFKNTQCDSQRALLITAYTWIFTALQIAFVAWLSDGVIGHFDASHKSIGLTRGDLEYICGSLTVLLFWRFLVSALLGSGNDGPKK